MAFVYHTARSLTGGTSTSLDGFTTASLSDGNTHICWTYDETAAKVYAHVFNPTGTAAESSPDIIRLDDYSTGGNWELMDSPFDVSAGVETGSLQIFTTSTVPTGYLECDGSAVSRTTYSALFAKISDDYGEGDGVNTFNIPDSRGRLLRGWDHGAGVDQTAASRTDRGDGTTGDNVGTLQAASSTMYNSWAIGATFGDNYILTEAESHGPNINVMVCIKY